MPCVPLSSPRDGPADPPSYQLAQRPQCGLPTTRSARRAMAMRPQHSAAAEPVVALSRRIAAARSSGSACGRTTRARSPRCPEIRERIRRRRADRAPSPRARPVVLGTLSVRVDPTAERMAIDSALEAGVPLVIANVVPACRPIRRRVAPRPGRERGGAAARGGRRRRARPPPTAPPRWASRPQHLRVATRDQVTALLEVVRENDAGLLVFGPDRRGSKPGASAAPPAACAATPAAWCGWPPTDDEQAPAALAPRGPDRGGHRRLMPVQPLCTNLSETVPGPDRRRWHD